MVETVQLMKRNDNLIIAIPKNFTSTDKLLFLEHLDGFLNTKLDDDEYGVLFSELTETAGVLKFRITMPDFLELYEIEIVVFQWDILSLSLRGYYCLELVPDDTERRKEILELREKVLLALEEFFSEKIQSLNNNTK